MTLSTADLQELALYTLSHASLATLSPQPSPRSQVNRSQVLKGLPPSAKKSQFALSMAALSPAPESATKPAAGFEIRGSTVNIHQPPQQPLPPRAPLKQQQPGGKALAWGRIRKLAGREPSPLYRDQSISLYQNSVSCLSSAKEEMDETPRIRRPLQLSRAQGSSLRPSPLHGSPSFSHQKPQQQQPLEGK